MIIIVETRWLYVKQHQDLKKDIVSFERLQHTKKVLVTLYLRATEYFVQINDLNDSKGHAQSWKEFVLDYQRRSPNKKDFGV